MAEGPTDPGTGPASVPASAQPASLFDPLWLLAPATDVPRGLRVELRGMAEADVATPELLQALQRVLQEMQGPAGEAARDKTIPPTCPQLTNCSKYSDQLPCPKLKTCGEYSIVVLPA